MAERLNFTTACAHEFDCLGESSLRSRTRDHPARSGASALKIGSRKQAAPLASRELAAAQVHDKMRDARGLTTPCAASSALLKARRRAGDARWQ